MNILITNDDGIKSEGLLILVKWATTIGNVTILAPKVEQSAKGQSINIHSPFEVKKVDYPVAGVTAYSVDSTPADCIRVALCGMKMKPDLVFSGINKGLNTGDDIAYSATDGAVFEASYFGYNCVAFSTAPETWEFAEKNLDRVWEFITSKRLFRYHNLYNVNIPLDAGKILVTKQKQGPYYRDTYDVDGDMYTAVGYSTYQGEKDLTVDLDAVMNGYISIAPLTTNRTDNEAYERLSVFNPVMRVW